MPQKPARCYTNQKKPPYTRKEYIHGVPPPKITKFVMGNTKLDAEVVVVLKAIEKGIVRHNALEAARVISHKFLSTEIGEQNFMLVIRKYPHQVLREHKMMAFAGADRLQEGMRRAFGKPVGVGAVVEPLDEVIEVRGMVQHVEILKEALRRAASKLPIKCTIEVRKLK
ncbi:50S ribosomal protein L16 [Ignisphaera sp. 4213-co]|uniref:Large ribosomal subunit protein uL16 n=1 Tax=Ignisphaera cupida TaxID=3050454 RepID=A0ABD4Z8L8_9CREN|nr:50S ribosomal protein L16 [Ignisphaera sp. 4213-co]MDK6029499.1 50S ribosomal protein L16 [Ignisphaera sp. 4213-co]